MSLEALPAPAPDAQLGARVDENGTSFSLWAPRATRVEVALVAPDRSQRNVDLEASPDGVWSTWVEGVGDGDLYGYRVHGPWNPKSGQRFNPARLLMDPYARAYTGGVDYAGPIRDHMAESNYLLDPTDSFLAVPLSVVVAASPAPPPVTRRSMSDSVIYELHVKGYTRLHPQVPEHLRGTYTGLAHPSVIEHLLATGVTAVELLPIHHFVSEPFVVGSGLTNYWGYNSMRYWVNEMGVDGFRFDLATTLIRDANHHVDQEHPLKLAMQTDPALQGVKLIAEPWDVGPYGYQVGKWGPGWSEWNDRFRGYVRDYWRGRTSGVQELATRLSGSPDLYDHAGRTPEASVNIITAHDGFTARDLVSYKRKHNDANKEHNRDGTDDTRSWNCGVEGETEDPAINTLRRRQVKNLLATMLLSFGTPMITAGDELGRTQLGNNNAYCQDGPISWVEWGQLDQWRDVHDFASRLLALRAQHAVLRSAVFRHRSDVLDRRRMPLGRHLAGVTVEPG